MIVVILKQIKNRIRVIDYLSSLESYTNRLMARIVRVEYSFTTQYVFVWFQYILSDE